jgi:hypothetical protein
MDDDFILATVIAGIVIVLIVFLVWRNSRGRRSVVKAIREAQEAFKLTPFVGTHTQLGAVWYAVRGQVSGLTIRIFGGKSSGGRGASSGTVARATAIDRACVMIIVSLPMVVPFRFNIQRRLALSTPQFGTSYAEFDKIAEVKTENEKKALSLLSNDQLRTAIISFMKSAAYAFITSSEVMIKISSDKEVVPVAREAVNLAVSLGNQIKNNSMK